MLPMAKSAESIALQRSPIACAVADAWARGRYAARGSAFPGGGKDQPGTSLADALDRLEAITRPSPLRKVKP